MKGKLMDKSFVSMEQKVCMVCATEYDSGTILLNKHLRNNMKTKTITGWGMCGEHQKLMDDGYIALVEATGPQGATTLRQDNAIRTGNICHLKRSVADAIFNVAIPIGIPMLFVEPGVIEKLQSMQEDT
jgi:hypothetical protein